MVDHGHEAFVDIVTLLSGSFSLVSLFGTTMWIKIKSNEKKM